MRTSVRILIIAGALLLAGCSLVPSRPIILPDAKSYPPGAGDMHSADSTPEVTAHYELLFVEFDDQGWLFPSKQLDSRNGDAENQLDFTMNRLKWLSSQKGYGGLDIFVFVHGWKHGARDDDDNLLAFKDQLNRTSQNESTAAWPHR